jgi:predicted amidohydrolase YtcJ
MKMISDGSLNTRSAFCSMPYSDIFPDFYGTLSYAPDQIETYFHVATCHGFAIACHAIGDEANTIVPNAAASTHAHGSIEHAQMLKPADIPRFAKLGLTASIQPQHAMDDRDVITRFWANPGGTPYSFKALHDAGVRLRMGSDAPVAPLDPWMAISAAVFGTESSDREPFQPEQCLDARTALAASTAVGRDHPEPGDPADLALLDRDPYAVSTPEEMRAMPVAATMLAGRWTYSSLHGE